jgi:predicted RNA binding protein YcfA (HicA-like mRNA interferase family)
MSGRFPVLSGKDLIAILQRRGFIFSRQSGSHAIMRHPDGRGTTVPVHGKRDLGKGLLRQILRDCNMTADDLNP